MNTIAATCCSTASIERPLSLIDSKDRIECVPQQISAQQFSIDISHTLWDFICETQELDGKVRLNSFHFMVVL